MILNIDLLSQIVALVTFALFGIYGIYSHNKQTVQKKGTDILSSTVLPSPVRYKLHKSCLYSFILDYFLYFSNYQKVRNFCN